MDDKTILDRLDSKERTIGRLGRRLGRTRFWLNGVEAKLGMKVSDFLKLDEARAGTKEAVVSQARFDVEATKRAEAEAEMDRMRKECDEALAEVERLKAVVDGRADVDGLVAERDTALAEVERLKSVAKGQCQGLRIERDDARAAHGSALRAEQDALAEANRWEGEAERLNVLLASTIRERDELKAVPKASDNVVSFDVVSLAAYQALQRDRDEAHAKHRTAHDALGRLDNQIDEAAEVLRGAFAPGPQGSVQSRVGEAIAILTREDGE